MNKLYVFDMDGTLIPKTTGPVEISKVTGKLKELESLENQFKDGLLNTKMFAKEIHKIWGVLDPTIIRKAFESCVKLKNIDTVISVLAARGDHSCIITMSPDFFAELFYEFGFDYVFASKFPRNKLDPLDTDKILTPEDKLKITERLCSELGIEMIDVVALGDSMSDEPLFRSLVHTVAVNGSPEIKKLAKYRYSGNDLYEIFELHNL